MTKGEKAIAILEKTADDLIDLDLPIKISSILRKLRAEAIHIRNVMPIFEELQVEVED